MQKISEYIGIDTLSLIKVLNYLPYPFLLSEYQNGHQFNIYVNKHFVDEIGYPCDEIPTIDEWFKKAYPDPTYREEVIRDWQNKLKNVDPKTDDYIVRQAKIQTKYAGAKWYEVKASIVGPINFVAFINIDQEIVREQDWKY